MGDDTAMPWEIEGGDDAVVDVTPIPAPAPAPVPTPKAEPAFVLKTADSAVEALFEKFNRPSYFSKNLPTMEVAEFDAKEDFLTSKTFHLSGRGMTDADAVILGSALEQLQPATIQNLYLTGNEVGDAGFAAIMGAMHNAPNLEVVYLAENKITDAGLEAMLGLVGAGGGAGIKQLSLHKNLIGDTGVKFLAKAIADGAFPELELLHLGHNQIGDEGAIALSEAFLTRRDHPITTIGLQFNELGDAALRSFALTLKKGSLRECLFIYVQNNQWGDEGEAALKLALKGVDTQGHFGWPPPKTESFLPGHVSGSLTKVEEVY